MKSIQASNRDKPSLMDRDIALVLHCVQCGTLRTFVLTTHINALLARQISALSVEAACSVCEHQIGATLVWTNQHEAGYSFRPTPPITGFKVEDHVGLMKPHRKERN